MLLFINKTTHSLGRPLGRLSLGKDGGLKDVEFQTSIFLENGLELSQNL
jgi:hypothetical protein